MPQKPTRSSNSKRPTRRNLDRRLKDMTGEDYSDLEPMTLAEAIAHDTEPVDEETGVVRIVETGELRTQGNVSEEIMAGLKSVYEDT